MWRAVRSSSSSISSSIKSPGLPSRVEIRCSTTWRPFSHKCSSLTNRIAGNGTLIITTTGSCCIPLQTARRATSTIVDSPRAIHQSASQLQHRFYSAMNSDATEEPRPAAPPPRRQQQQQQKGDHDHANDDDNQMEMIEPEPAKPITTSTTVGVGTVNSTKPSPVWTVRPQDRPANVSNFNGWNLPKPPLPPQSVSSSSSSATPSTSTTSSSSSKSLSTMDAQASSELQAQRKQILKQAVQSMVGYNASHRFSDSMRVFHSLRRQQVDPDIVVSNLYLEALASQGRIDEMFQLYEEIKTRLPLNILTFNNLMKGLILSGDVDRAEELFDEIEKAQLQPNIFTYNLFFEVACRFHRYRQGWKMYEKMINRNKTVPRHLQVTPNINTFKSLIALSLGARMGVSAYDFLREAETYKLVLEEEIYKKVFSACIKVEHPDGCLYLVQALESRFKRVHDEGTYLRVMTIGAKKGRYDVAEAMWNATERAGIAFRSPMYHAMLNAYAKSARIEEAFRTIHAMERDNIPIHYPSLRSLIDILSSSTPEDIDRAYFLLSDMANAGEKVSLVSLNIIVESCSSIRDLDRAFATITEYSKFGLTPNLQSYNALLQGCVRVRQMSTCFKIFSDIRDNGFVPDALTYRLMIVCCIRSLNIERALDVFDEMIESKVRPDNTTFVVMLRQARRMGEPRLIDKLGKTMLALGIDPDHFRAFTSDQVAIDSL